MEKHEIIEKFTSEELSTLELLKEVEKAFLGFSYIEDNNDTEGEPTTTRYWGVLKCRLHDPILAAKREAHKLANYDLITLAEGESPQDFDFLQVKIGRTKVMVYVWFSNQWLLNCHYGVVTPEYMQEIKELQLYDNIVWGEVLRPKVLV